jgi:hypothetical protein
MPKVNWIPDKSLALLLGKITAGKRMRADDKIFQIETPDVDMIVTV